MAGEPAVGESLGRGEERCRPLPIQGGSGYPSYKGDCMHSLRQRLNERLNVRDESAFTLIELLVVLIIIGVLLAIAVPSYLGFKDRAQKTAAASNVRAAIPDAEAFYSDNGTYVGMDNPALKLIDSGVASGLTTGDLSVNTYCLTDTQGSHVAEVHGPGGTVYTDDQSGYQACT